MFCLRSSHYRVEISNYLTPKGLVCPKIDKDVQPGLIGCSAYGRVITS